MGLLTPLRIQAQSAWDDFWYQPVAPLSGSGIGVTPETALKTSAVFACVRILSESLAGLPLIIYQRQRDGGRERASDHPLFDLLHDAPNATQTAFAWLAQGLLHCLLYGNAYSQIGDNGRALADLEIVEIMPRRDLDRARSQFGVGIIVANDPQAPSGDRLQYLLADHAAIARIVGMDRDRHVRQHRFGPRRRDHGRTVAPAI